MNWTRRELLQAGAAWGAGAMLHTPAAWARPDSEERSPAEFAPIEIPDWVHDVHAMAYLTPGEVEEAAALGVQVVHGNAVWPYYPLHRDGGKLPQAEHELLTRFVESCRRHGMKLVLGLPPFPSVDCMRAHPEWRVDPDGSGAVRSIEPRQENLGTRLGCNNGPWGDFLIEICAELIEDYDLDGYSFDGNYHAPLCRCPACTEAYAATGRPLPAKVDQSDLAYRRYLAWRGERLEAHYRKLQQRIKAVKRGAVLMSWTVNAGRYGHYLHLPRAMPTRLNLLFDLPMQEWWLDETNQGASVAPAFGAAYLRATTNDRPAASEPYLMSRGNPYGTDSFPPHERLTRVFLAMTNGCQAPQALGWTGQRPHNKQVFQEIARRAPWTTRTETWPWLGLLVSEQTRQFYAYRDVAGTYLPHLFGAFRACVEEHLPAALINDWNVTSEGLARHRAVLLPNAAALSDAQCAALREYVHAGGGIVATGETSLCDEWGAPRGDFALKDLFGASYEGRPAAPLVRPELDANFAIAIDDKYWQERTGSALLRWRPDETLFDDAVLRELVPGGSVRFKGPLVAASLAKAEESAAEFQPDGSDKSYPAVVMRQVGQGRVAWCAAALDAALWSYGYPYQRRLLRRLIEWAAGQSCPIQLRGPMCVQMACFLQRPKNGSPRWVLHFFNGVNTAAHHGQPANDVPLREESIPIHGMELHWQHPAPDALFVEPDHVRLPMRREENATIVALPPLDRHYLVVSG